VATARLRTNAIAAAIYAATAFHDAVEPANAEITAKKEREWQLQHLRKLSESWSSCIAFRQ